MEKVALDRLTLLDLNGNSVKLNEYFHNYLLLIFLRHLAWLPCQAHLGEVRAFKDHFEARGVSIVVVSFAEPERLVRYQKHHKWPFVVLADPRRTAYDAFALKRLSWFQVFSPATVKLYWRLWREGKKREDYGRDDIYQGGGDFLLDRDGNLLFAHRSRDPADRPAAAKLLEIIDRKIFRTATLTR